MGTGRLEAFSDGVLAIIITIMVLELKAPHEPTWAALRHDTGTGLVVYLLSFVYVGIYWNNHHHMLQLCNRVSGGVLWANLHLLFWLSLLPFSTKWMGEDGFAQVPVVVYGINLFLAGVAYFILERTIIGLEGADSALNQAVGRGYKELISPPLYVLGIAVTFIDPWLGMACYIAAALMWLVPDRRLERFVAQAAEPASS
jgi:uncharacterized membrane protein